MPEEYNDRKKLEEIIEKLTQVLRNMDNSRELIFGENLRGALHEAWQELDGPSGRIKTLRDNLGNPNYSLENSNYPFANNLSNAGLSDKQLEPKYKGFLDSCEQLTKWGGIRRLKSVLRWGKTILGSVATLVPGIREVAEIIKEYVEAAEIGIDKAEES